MAACCAEDGYAAVTIAAVADRAGLSQESFEEHFEGVEDCALGALNQIVSETLAAVATARSGADETEDRIFQIRAILELMEARPAFARLGYIEARHGGSERMRDAYQSAVQVLALMMERAGGNSGAPTQAGRAALGGAEAVVRRALSKKEGGELSRYLPDFVYAALVPFVGQGEALRQSRAAAKLLAEEE